MSRWTRRCAPWIAGALALVGLVVLDPAAPSAVALSSLDSPQGVAVMVASGSTLAVSSAGALVGVGAYGWSEGWFSGEGSDLPVSAGMPPGWDAVPSWPPPDFANLATVAPSAEPVYTNTGTQRVVSLQVAATAGSIDFNGRARYECRSGIASTTDPTGYQWSMFTMTTVGPGLPAQGPATASYSGVCNNSQDIRLNFHSPVPYATAGGYVYAHWYPEGSQWRPAPVEQGMGTLTRTAECTNAAGDVQTVTDSIAAMKDAKTEMPALGCPEGYMMTGYGSSWTADGGASVEIVPDGTDTPWAGVPGAYPECVGNLCLVTLWEVTPAGLASCGVLAVACPEWYSHPAREDVYQCQYGPYVVELSACSTMRTPGQVRPNAAPTPDGKVEVKTWPTLAPDPALGESPLPVPEPVPDPEPAPEPAPRDCWPNGYSVFNPFQWVFMPIRCAFEPRSGVAWTPVRTAVVDSAIGEVGFFLGDIADGSWLPDPSGCGRIVDVDLPVLFGETFVVDTCDEWWDNAGGMRTIIGFAFIAGAVFGGVRMVLRTIRVDAVTEFKS